MAQQTCARLMIFSYNLWYQIFPKFLYTSTSDCNEPQDNKPIETSEIQKQNVKDSTT